MKFQETFLEKFLVSGFGAEAPTDNAHKKTRRNPRFLICLNVLELRSKPPFLTFLERKVSQRTSPRIHHFILAKLLKFQETFLEKFLVSGFGADAPTDNAHKKTRRNLRFLICRRQLELPFQTSALRGFFKSPLKILKTFAPNIRFITLYVVKNKHYKA